MALLLAAPANRIFLVGDDDQSIYGWRLADVRRVLALADDLAGPAAGRPRRRTTAARRRSSGGRSGSSSTTRERFAKTIERAPTRRVRSSSRPMPADESARVDGSSGRGFRTEAGPATDATSRPGRSSPGRTASSCRRSPPRSSAGSRSGRRRSSSSSTHRSSTRCLDELADGDRRRLPLLAGDRGASGRAGPREPPDPDGRPGRRPPGRHRRGRPGLGGAPSDTLDALRGAIDGAPSRPARALPRRRPADLRDRPRDEGPRVRPCRGARHGARPLPERPLARRRARARPGARGGAPARLCRVDPCAALAHPRLRPGRTRPRSCSRRSIRTSSESSRRRPPTRLPAWPRKPLPDRSHPVARRRPSRPAWSTCGRPSGATSRSSSRWFNDRRTTRTLADGQPDERDPGGALVRPDARAPGQGPLALRRLPARRRPAGRRHRPPRGRSPERQRESRDPDRRPGRHRPGLRQRCPPHARRLRVRPAPAGTHRARRVRLQRAAPDGCTSGSGSGRRGRSVTRVYRDGAFHDVHRMAILRDEWAAVRPVD